jgi:ribonuclease H2 subunit C
MTPQPDGDDHDDDDPPEPVHILCQEAAFDEITVWGHDVVPAADDGFVKGIEEWISFAEAVEWILPFHLLWRLAARKQATDTVLDV